ncbi:MAG: flagellar protein [Spirochaetales bacterium]|nr:flagellar protein [Spirochaetales bacterium]
MKRIILLITIMGLLICGTAFSQEADAAETLIDFNNLLKNKTLEDGRGENAETLVYFGGEAGVTATEEMRQRMVSSLAIENWRVTLSSSSKTVARQSLCKTKEVKTKDDIGVMGVRVRFPESNFNAYALVEPPFEIQAYQRKYQMQGDDIVINEDGQAVEDETDTEGTKFDNKGVLKNVGIIKQIIVEVYGANYPHGLGVMLMDQNYETRIYHLGYLNFEGWKKLQWDNPNYIEDVRHREITKYPLYPRAVPYIKLVGFVIYRDASAWGGDFITYFKNVQLVYDDAVEEADDPEIKHEDTWGIIRDRNEARRKVEYQRLGERLLLEILERQKTVEYKEATVKD